MIDLFTPKDIEKVFSSKVFWQPELEGCIASKSIGKNSKRRHLKKFFKKYNEFFRDAKFFIDDTEII